MTTEDKALALVGGLGGAFIVANLMVVGAILAERRWQRRLCDGLRRAPAVSGGA